MRIHLLASISLLSIAFAAALPAVAATAPGAAPTVQKPKLVRTAKPPVSANKAGVAPGKTVGQRLADVNGDGKADATARTTPPGGARGKEFTGPICDNPCGGCSLCDKDPKKPASGGE